MGRQRASLSASLRTSTSSLRTSTSSLSSPRSPTSPIAESAAGSSATLARSAERASAASESSPSIRRTSPTRARIRASFASMWGSTVLQRTPSVDRPIRRMRLRDQLDLAQVRCLSPLPAEGHPRTQHVGHVRIARACSLYAEYHPYRRSSMRRYSTSARTTGISPRRAAVWPARAQLPTATCTGSCRRSLARWASRSCLPPTPRRSPSAARSSCSCCAPVSAPTQNSESI